MNLDEASVEGIMTTPTISQNTKRRRLSQSSSVTDSSSSAAQIVAEGMKNAVNQLKDQRHKREDEFDAFGKYVATELRSLSDTSAARRVRFKVARCLMASIEDENQSITDLMTNYFVLQDNTVVLNQETAKLPSSASEQ